MLRSQKIIFQIVGALIFIGIVIFIYFGYARYRKGPQINSINLDRFMEVHTPSLTLTAELKNTKAVNINGRETLIKNGNTLSEILVFSPGDNIIHIRLTDSLSKQRDYEYHIFYVDKEQHYPYSLHEAQESLQQQTEEESLTTSIN